jgi:hypothetical protein
MIILLSFKYIYICLIKTDVMYKKGFCIALLILPAFLMKAQESSSGAPAADPNAAVMSFETKDHDFGTIDQDGNGTYLFLFTNTGREPLMIKEAHGSCGCTVPKWPHEPVPPGQRDTIRVTYDTHTHIGAFQKTVTITSNAKEGTDVLAIKGKVLAKPKYPDFPTNPASNNSGTPYANNWDNQ